MILFSFKSYQNICLFIFYDIETKESNIFEISNNYNELKSILIYLKKNNNKYIVGYNMEKYYNYILNYILINYNELLKDTANIITFKINNLSKNIFLNLADVSLKYNSFYRSIDLLKYISSSSERISFNDVKNYFNIDITEPLFKNDDYVSNNNKIEIIDYLKLNINALYLLYNRCIDKINFRIKLSNKIGINILNKFDESIGNNFLLGYFKKQYSVSKDQIISLKEKIPEKYPVKISDILIDISFNNQSIINFVDVLKSSFIENNYRINTIIKLNEDVFIINKYIKKDCDEKIYECDLININFKNIYIETLCRYDIYPEFLGNEFREIIESEYKLLLKAFDSKNKEEADYHSLILSNLIDNMSVPSSLTESCIAQNRVLINSLLIILKLIDELIKKDIQIICMNKESITLKVSEKDKSYMCSILSEWKNSYCNHIEISEYEKLIYLDSNNNLVFKKGYYKNKDLINFETESGIKKQEQFVIENGIFKTKRDFNNIYQELITSKAIQVFFGKGESAKDYIFNNNNIEDFLISYKCNQTFNLYLNENRIQNYIKYYFVNNKENIFRENLLTNKKEKIIENIKLLNKSKEVNDINKMNYYKNFIKSKSKIINNQLKLF